MYYNSITNNMRDKHYKVRCIRLDDDNWDKLNKDKKKSNLSWNLFIKELNKQRYEQNN